MDPVAYGEEVGRLPWTLLMRSFTIRCIWGPPGTGVVATSRMLNLDNLCTLGHDGMLVGPGGFNLS